SEHADFLFFQHPECVDDLLDEPVHLLGVDALHLLEQAEVVAEVFGYVNKGAQVLRETTAAKAQTGVEKSPTDPRVHANPVGDLLDVRARRLAYNRYGVNVGN